MQKAEIEWEDSLETVVSVCCERYSLGVTQATVLL